MAVVSSYIETLAKDFWVQVGQTEKKPPYDIIGAISLLLPLDIVCMSELTLGNIDQWLLNNGIKIPINVNDRSLHGFILISKGLGFMFVNGTDSEEERRYTIAHEASHFILDYKIPRDKVIQKLGYSVKEVLDGLREPTIEELINGLVGRVSVRPFTHLLEKDGNGSFENMRIFDSENKADMLALELLAPHTEVIKTTMAGRSKISFTLFDRLCYGILTSKYLLPDVIAKQYSRRLAYSVTGGPSIMDKLGF